MERIFTIEAESIDEPLFILSQDILHRQYFIYLSCSIMQIDSEDMPIDKDIGLLCAPKCNLMGFVELILNKSGDDVSFSHIFNSLH